MLCTFMQSTSNGNMNVHDDLKLNVFYCQTILESFSLIDVHVVKFEISIISHFGFQNFFEGKFWFLN